MLQSIKKLCLSLVFMGSFCLGMNQDFNNVGHFFTLAGAGGSHFSMLDSNSNVGLTQRAFNLNFLDNVQNGHGSTSSSNPAISLQFDVQSIKQKYEAFTSHVQTQMLKINLDTFKEYTTTLSSQELIDQKSLLIQALPSIRQQFYDISYPHPRENDWQHYNDLFTSKQLETQVMDHQQKIEHCNQLIAAHDNKMIVTTETLLGSMPACDVVGKEIPKLQSMMKQLDGSIAQGQKEIMRLVAHNKSIHQQIVAIEQTTGGRLGLKNGQLASLRNEEKTTCGKIAAIKTTINLQKDRQYEAKIELETAYKHIEKVKIQLCKDLKQAQQFLSELRDSGLLNKADQELLHAINLTIFDEGNFSYQAYNTLTQDAKDFLQQAGISPEKFESMTAANALQKHLFEDIGNKLNDLVALSTMHLNDAQIIESLNLAVSNYGATLDMVATSTPSQMVAAHKFSSALDGATHIAIEAKQGIAPGKWTYTKEAFLRDVQHSCDIIKDTFLHPIDACQSFRNLPFDQKLDRTMETVAAVLTVVAEANGRGQKFTAPKMEGLKKVANIIKLEIAGLANLAHNIGSGASSISAHEEVTWSFWGDLAKVTKCGREYALIEGQLFARHAIDRMTPSYYGYAAGGVDGRSIPYSVVKDVIQNGSWMKLDIVNGIQRMGKVIDRVVVVFENEFIISVRYK